MPSRVEDRPNSAPLHLSPLPGDLGAKTLDINGDGFVVGISSWGGNGRHAVVWRVAVAESGVMVEGPVPLYPLPGDGASEANSVETRLDGAVLVAGESVHAGDSTAVAWTLSFNADGTLAGGGVPVSLGGIGTSATGVNDQGAVTGSIDPQPALAASDGLLEPLPVPNGVYAADGIAEALNNNGDVVGYLDIYTSKRNISYKTLAYLWKGGTCIDLNTQIDPRSGWGQLKYASAISDGGIIVGVGSYDVAYRGFVMAPNP